MKICIIGGGAGARSASRGIRQLNNNIQIDLFTAQNEIDYAPCEPPFVLRGSLEWKDIFYSGNFYEKSNICVHLKSRVTNIDRKNKYIAVGDQTYPYDKLILATGAIPSIPSIHGLDGKNEYTLGTNIADGKTLQQVISNHSTAAIIGSGAIGVEMAMALISKGYKKVYLLDMQENILPASLDKDMASLVESEMKKRGIELIMGANIKSIHRSPEGKCLALDDHEIAVPYVILSTGSHPNIELARKAGITIGKTGGILVNQYLQSNDPDIYAAGDCIENYDRIIGQKTRRLMVTTADRTGYIAGINVASQNPVPYEGTLLTFAIEILGYQVGTVGFTEKTANEKGLDILSITKTAPTTRAQYGGKPVHYKLIADRQSKRLIGAQIISEEKIRGMINEVSFAIAEKIAVKRLSEIETPYSPAIGLDPLLAGIIKLMGKLG
jgi:NADPH-dependent 2,4-dienoyl-CoA reductase/sulfur reductase-like enzyme